jgi:microcystin-dependent protein
VSQPFLAEIKIISWNFPPKGWAFCSGQLLPINQNQALFSLLGTTYGGNGQTTFALPDFRGRVPMHVGGGFLQGQAGGQEFHTITAPRCRRTATSSRPAPPPREHNAPTGAFPATDPDQCLSGLVQYDAGAKFDHERRRVSAAHENRQPFLVLNFIIALQGIFPSRN